MAPEIVKKIATLIRNLSSGNEERAAKELKKNNLPRKTSVLRQAELVLFTDAVLQGRSLVAEEVPWGAPTAVFPAPEKEEAPGRYSTWPNFPGERERIKTELFKVEMLISVPAGEGAGIISGDNFALRVRPVLNDDRENCFFASLGTRKKAEGSPVEKSQCPDSFTGEKTEEETGEESA